MNAAALKRVERYVCHESETPTRGIIDGSVSSCCGETQLTLTDLRAVLALAKQAGELKRRTRLARKALDSQIAWCGKHRHEDVRAALREPLPKAGRK